MLDGRVLSDRYQVREMIGGGGMANVYLARDLILDRDVALKVLRPEYVHDQEFIARFDREAQAATSLSHPNIVSIYDVGEEDNILYIVMEYVKGMTLKEYIKENGPIEVSKSIHIMQQLTSAIGHAHENGIVHRDIKPQNILMDPNGQVKVTDFGIAMALSATALTQTNSVLGSVHYLSPEQARGGNATKKSDIYSLGIVFFELLTGRLPFSGQSPVSIALKHLQDETPSVRSSNQSIPQSVENIVLKATDKDPFNRFASAYEMETSLDNALDPKRMHEPKYVSPTNEEEKTKAIPIISDRIGELEQQDEDEHTMIHHANEIQEKVVSGKKGKKNKVKKKTKTKKVKSKKKKWLFLLIGGFVIMVSVILALFLIPHLLKPKDVDVPDVIGEKYEDAVEELENLHLQVKMESVFSDEIAEGFVVKTDPKPGKTVKEQYVVTLFVSQGKEKEVFEDFVGKDFEQVRRLLEERGYEVIAYDKHSERPKGEILNQIQPNPDQEVVPVETKVIFEVSIGPELINLNNLKGMTEDEAASYLKDKGLKMKKIEENSDVVPKGQVIKQSPESNTSLEKGATVDVYISTGPTEKPPASHTITFTVPYDLDENEDDEEKVAQEVKIYISDIDHDITDVFQEDEITEDKEYTITLTIAPNDYGEYKVVRDGKLFIEKTVPYKEGE
ncbi:Stk1 family PASTA domain-containing Ser/Thr kinase [Virgibacillus soli]